jgi:hypothetical protein
MVQEINNQQAAIEVAHLSAGTYIVKVSTDTETQSLKIIKQ